MFILWRFNSASNRNRERFPVLYKYINRQYEHEWSCSEKHTCTRMRTSFSSRLCFTRAGIDGRHRGTITYSIVIGRQLTLLCGGVALNELLKITTEYTILKSFFLHSRYNQHTPFHFTFSGLKIMSSDSRT